MESFKITYAKMGRFWSPVNIWLGRMTRVEDHLSLLFFNYKLARKERAGVKNDRKGVDMRRLSGT